MPAPRDVPDACLAEPWTMSDDEQAAAGCVIGRDYRAPASTLTDPVRLLRRATASSPGPARG